MCRVAERSPLRFVRAAAAALVLAGSTGASAAPATDVPDRFRVEFGGFRIGSSTELTFSTSGVASPPVDFEALNVPENATRFYLEGFWRLSRRHEVSLSWYRHNREGDPRTTERELTWGDRVIGLGSTVEARVDSHYFSGVYRFAAYKNERFEIGPSVGIGYLSIDAGIRGEVDVTGAGSAPAREFDLGRSLNQPTGDLGGYLYWWPMTRLLVRSEGRYIIVKPENAEASVADARAAAVYHPWRNIGVGLQYTYTRFRYERDIVSTELGGRLRYSGGQLVLSTAF